MEVVVGDIVLGKARHDVRGTAGATALQNAIAAVRKDITSRAAPKSSSMLHGISIVDRKNMTKTEEELMRQLVQIFGTKDMPQLRAKSNVRGEGWTMELVVNGQVIGLGRNARRGAAGEAALSSALQSVQGRVPGGAGSMSVQHSSFDDGDDSTPYGITVIGENNMSGTERELMERLRAACMAADLAEPPELRAKRNPRGDDGWTMDVVVGDRVLSTAHGKRRCVAGEKALNKAITACTMGGGGKPLGVPMVAGIEPALLGASSAAGPYAGFAQTGGLIGPGPLGVPPGGVGTLRPGLAGAVVGPQSLVNFASAATTTPLTENLSDEDIEVEKGLVAQLREVCDSSGVPEPPQIAVKREKVWGKEWWTVEVVVALRPGGPLWLVEEGKKESRADAGVDALKKAIATAAERAQSEQDAKAEFYGGQKTQVPQVNMAPKSRGLLNRLKSALQKAGMPTKCDLWNCGESKGNKQVWSMEVTCGELSAIQRIGAAQAKRWADAGELALQSAIDFVEQRYKNPNDPRLARRGGDDLHGIRVVDKKNMTKTEEDLLGKLELMCAQIGIVGVPELKAQGHDPVKQGWTMVVAVGNHVLGTGQNPRRGAAGEGALQAAIQAIRGIKAQQQAAAAAGAAASSAPAAGPGTAGSFKTIAFTPTRDETTMLGVLRAGVERLGHHPSTIQLVATASDPWNVEVWFTQQKRVDGEVVKLPPTRLGAHRSANRVEASSIACRIARAAMQPQQKAAEISKVSFQTSLSSRSHP